MKITKNIFIYVFLISNIFSCASNNEIKWNESILNLNIEKDISFRYELEFDLERRLNISEIYKPDEISEYIKLIEKNSIELKEKDSILRKNIPKAKDIIASSFLDLKRGFYSKAIEKINFFCHS